MFRRVLQVVSLALISTAPVSVQAGSGLGLVEVATVHPTRVADLVILRGGYDSGLRQGMVCRVTRGSTEIADLLLVELRPAYSAALIVKMAPKQSIRAGDIASIKVSKS